MTFLVKVKVALWVGVTENESMCRVNMKVAPKELTVTILQMGGGSHMGKSRQNAYIRTVY
jgi:hypothetical protein